MTKFSQVVEILITNTTYLLRLNSQTLFVGKTKIEIELGLYNDEMVVSL